MEDAWGCGISAIVLACVLAFGGIAVKGCGAGANPGPVKEQVAPATPVGAAVAWPDFTVGTTAFWTLTATIVVFMMVCTVYEQDGVLTVISLVVFLAAVQFMGGSDPAGYAALHWKEAIACFVAYFACGIAWGFIKWYLFVLAKRQEYEAFRAEWLSSMGERNTNAVPEHLKAQWRTVVRSDMTTRPQALREKSRIVNWISLWPISVLTSVLVDGLRNLATALYRVFARWYQGIANAAWRGIDNDLAYGDAEEIRRPK